MSAPHDLSEEELAQLEAEMARITVDDVLLQTLVTLLNLAARKAGLATPPGTPSPPAPAPDLEQVRQAIEGARALMPLLEQRHADKLGPVRDTLSRLQMAYAQLAQGGTAPAASQAPEGGAPAGEGAPESGDQDPQGPGPAQSSGRLWIPGQ
jgi:hypothetical protein